MSVDEEFRKWLATSPSSDYDYPGVTRETQLIGFSGHLLQENAKLREERKEARSWAEHWRAIFGSAEGFKFPWEAEEVKG